MNNAWEMFYLRNENLDDQHESVLYAVVNIRDAMAAMSDSNRLILGPTIGNAEIEDDLMAHFAFLFSD